MQFGTVRFFAPGNSRLERPAGEKRSCSGEQVRSTHFGRLGVQIGIAIASVGRTAYWKPITKVWKKNVDPQFEPTFSTT
ncbi:MAG: hypothetical protein SFV81_23435 [Pirellulaceae bacterium]|nr:hypothetical protein [Pirellulaceae bacterium]